MKPEALQTGDAILINGRIERVLKVTPSANPDAVTIHTRFGPESWNVTSHSVRKDDDVRVVMDD